MNLDELRSLFAFDAWANDLVIEAAGHLDDESLKRDLGASHQSILGTLVHLVAAEEIWLSRFQGAPKPRLTSVAEVPDLTALRAFWEKVREERDAYVADLGEGDLERELEMSTTSGATYRHRFAEMFRHLANHSTYHRGQVVTLLRQLGQKPPATDLIRFYRLRPELRQRSIHSR